MKNRLREAREDMRMTQEGLAEKSGVSRQTISTLENETNDSPNAKTLVRIAEALNTTVDKVFFIESEQ